MNEKSFNYRENEFGGKVNKTKTEIHQTPTTIEFFLLSFESTNQKVLSCEVNLAPETNL